MAQQQPTKKRHWCFTSFVDLRRVKFDPLVVRYCCFQLEICEETKRPHTQGYIEFFGGVRMGQVKSVLGECHCESRKGSRDQAREYCRKLATAVPNTFQEFGLWREDVSHKRKLADMLKAKCTIDEIIEVNPIDYVRYHRGLEKLAARRFAAAARKFRIVEVTVLVGKTGTGKTRRATQGVDWFIMPTSERLWFDGYNGEGTLILDDFYGNIRYSRLLRMLDGHALQMPVKGGFIWAQWTKVIITSNSYPNTWYKIPNIDAMNRRITDVITMDELSFIDMFDDVDDIILD